MDFEKREVKFVPADKGNGWYALGIEIQGRVSRYLHWIETETGCICTIDRLDLARSICETKPMIEAYCEKLQAMFENDEIGWANVNMKKSVS